MTDDTVSPLPLYNRPMRSVLSPEVPSTSASTHDAPNERPPRGSSPTFTSERILKRSAGSPSLTTAQKKKELKTALSKMMMGYAKNFWRYDTDGSGEIDRDEFAASLLGLKLPYADDEETVNRLFDEMDFDGLAWHSLNPLYPSQCLHGS